MRGGSYTYLIMFRRVLLLSVLALTGCAAELETPDAPDHAEAAQTAQHGRIGSHGMVLVGTPDSAYLSHVPMFHAPHDVQMILSVHLDGQKLPSSFSERLFTFLPETLSLDDLRLGQLKSFHGTVFLGSCEIGGTPVAKNVTVTVTSIVHQHILDGKAAPQGWFVFGNAAQAFAAHRITTSPGFDQIVKIQPIADRRSFIETTGADVPMTDKPVGKLVPVTSLSCLVGPDFVDACE